jgi:hypothetical protein
MYNLLDEQWLPVSWADGTYKRVGIKVALTAAHRIKQIAASNPMERLAVIRFLLALLYWCRGNPPNLNEIAETQLPADWFTKLDENRAFFNLLGEGKRFYQYRKSGDKPLTANYLVHEIPTGTNFWHFRHATDERNGLCSACCALGLLRLPLFTTQGGQGKSPGINAKPPIYIIPMGNTLAETLLLSWQPITTDLGIPAWEEPGIPLPASGNVPLLTGLTWLPRRVWLSEPQRVEAKCISCGRQAYLIYSSVFAGIGSTKTTGRIWNDPHVIYGQNKKGEAMSLHSINAIDNADAGAGQWARIMTGVSRNLLKYNAKTWVVAFSTDQNKYLEALEFYYSWPGKTNDLELFMMMLDVWQQSGYNLNYRLKSSDNRELSLKRPEFQSMLASIRPQVENKVSNSLGQLLSGSDEAWQEAAGEYQPMMKAVARSLSPGYTIKALEKQRRISSALPDMK